MLHGGGTEYKTVRNALPEANAQTKTEEKKVKIRFAWKRLLKLAVATTLIIAFAAAPPAFGDSILRVSAFSGSTFDAIGVTPFDPTLGTLDSVNIGILGTLYVSIFAPPFITLQGSTYFPAPYFYQLSVNQSFSGLGNTYFDFASDAIFRLSDDTTGAGENFTFARPFSYGFTFNSTTDLAGFTIPASAGPDQLPTSISGQRTGFYPNPQQVNEVDLIQSWSPLYSTGVPVTITNVLSAGSMTFEYNYTPPPPPVTPVPEPATLLLLGFGIAGLAVFRKRFKA